MKDLELYAEIVTRLSAKAFDECKEKLFVKTLFCKYHSLLQLDEYRRIDLLEDIERFTNVYFLDKKTKESERLTHMIHCVGFYYDNYIHCAPNSRAEAYHARGKDLITNIIKTQDYNLDDLDDLYKIYFSLMRSELPIIDDETATITEIDFETTMNDVELVDNIFSHKYRTQKFGKKEIDLIVVKAKNLLNDYLSDQEKQFDYILNMLFICRLKDKACLYGEE